MDQINSTDTKDKRDEKLELLIKGLVLIAKSPLQ